VYGAAVMLVFVQVGILFAEQSDQMGMVEVVVKDVYQNTPAAASGYHLSVSVKCVA
jgi:hypothetical protein